MNLFNCLKNSAGRYVEGTQWAQDAVGKEGMTPCEAAKLVDARGNDPFDRGALDWLGSQDPSILMR